MASTLGQDSIAKFYAQNPKYNKSLANSNEDKAMFDATGSPSVPSYYDTNNVNTHKMDIYNMDGGLGNYGVYTLPNGSEINIDESAYKAMNGTTLDGGSLAKTPNSWTGPNGYLAGAANVVGAVNGIANSLVGYENLQLAKKQYDADVATSNRNAINQATTYNSNLDNSAAVGMSLAGNTMTAGDRVARQAQIDRQKLSTAPVV